MNNKNIRKLFSSLRFIPFSKILLDEDTFNHTLMNFNEDYDTLSKWEEFQDRFYKEFCGFLSFETHIKNYFNNIKKTVYDNLLIEEREEINNKNIEFLKNKRDDLVEGKSYLSIDLSKAYDLIIDKFGNLDKPIQEIREHISKKELISKNKGVRIEEYRKNNMDKYRNYVYIFLDEILKGNSNIIKQLNIHNCPLIYVRLDEMIFDITDKEKEFEKYLSVKTISGYNVHIKMFKYHVLFYNDYYDVPHIFEMREHINGNTEFCMINSEFINQLYKIYKKEEPTEKDLRIKSCDVAKPYYQLKDPVKIITKDEYLNYWLDKNMNGNI